MSKTKDQDDGHLQKVLRALGAKPRGVSGGNIAIGIWVSKIVKSLKKQGRL